MKPLGWRNVLNGVILVFILFIVPSIMVGVGFELKNSDNFVPEVRISLSGVDLETIKTGSKENIYKGNSLELVEQGKELEFDNIEVKGRGNATWAQIKKPLQIKFGRKVNLLGLGERKKWILLANYLDDTNLRTDAAFYVEKMLGEKYPYEGKFVNLYVDDAYEGLFYLTRGIEIGKGAVDLKNPLGVLVELDNIYGRLEERYYLTENKETLTVKDLVNTDREDEAMQDFLGAFNEMELAIREGNFNRLAAIADIDSFVKYFLLEELISNPDAYFTSQYFYKDGPNDKIHAGPGWDFDASFNGWGTFLPDAPHTRREVYDEYLEDQYGEWSRLFARLIMMPEFQEVAGKIFEKKLLGKKEELISHIKRTANEIEEAAYWNNRKWGRRDFRESVDEVLEWVNLRYDYFEKQYSEYFVKSDSML